MFGTTSKDGHHSGLTLVDALRLAQNDECAVHRSSDITLETIAMMSDDPTDQPARGQADTHPALWDDASSCNLHHSVGHDLELMKRDPCLQAVPIGGNPLLRAFATAGGVQMSGITSYAQNFEDVILWRALGHVGGGFYIDIGAQDPVKDSVSLAFHERKWRGIHVEPTAHYGSMLRMSRPGDLVLQVAVSEYNGLLQFFEIPNTGISTAAPEVASTHKQNGFDVQEIWVPSVTLASIFELNPGQEIHWLKVDVEGGELGVLRSWEASSARPWVVVVESTLPLSSVESYASWEPELLARGYHYVAFDGLNRFYLHDTHSELRAALSVPANVFDDFKLTPESFTSQQHLIVEEYEERLRVLAAPSAHGSFSHSGQTIAEHQCVGPQKGVPVDMASVVAAINLLRADVDSLKIVMEEQVGLRQGNLISTQRNGEEITKLWERLVHHQASDDELNFRLEEMSRRSVNADSAISMMENSIAEIQNTVMQNGVTTDEIFRQAKILAGSLEQLQAEHSRAKMETLNELSKECSQRSSDINDVLASVDKLKVGLKELVQHLNSRSLWSPRAFSLSDD